MCAGISPELAEQTSFIGRWLEILRPGYDRVLDEPDAAERIRALEREAVAVSIANLSSFPFVSEAVGSEALSLHGLFFDISEGRLEALDGESGTFAPI
jgi:carbonic anhydrase